MGAYLEKPNTKKHTLEDKNATLKYAASSMQGWRVNMEDAEICDLNLSGGLIQCFAVFDGHGGEEVAKFCGKNFVKELQANQYFQKGDYKQALIQNFMRMDEILQSPQGKKELQEIKGGMADGTSQAGCTGNVILITKNKIYCANAGDSRSVLCYQGEAKALSEDHKPENPGELNRIKEAGGEVWEGRVNGNLNLSRAIGDLEYKQNSKIPANKQLIIAEPEVKEYDISKNLPDFIVMGCDGIWEVLSNQQVVTHFERALKQKPIKKCVEDFLDEQLAKDTTGMYGLDNMTCICIKFFK